MQPRPDLPTGRVTGHPGTGRACGVTRAQALLKRLPGDRWRLTPGE